MQWFDSLCVQISADNVGQFTVSGCTFSSLPRAGLTVTGLAKLSITDNVFSMIQVRSGLVVRSQTTHYLCFRPSPWW